MTEKLTDKQVLFCQEYVTDFQAKAAYIRAGYAEKSADQNSSRMMSLDKIQRYIQELTESRAQRLQVTADEVIRRLDNMSKASVKGLFDERDKPLRVSEWPDELADAVSSIKFTSMGDDSEAQMVDVKFVDKKGATELLGKHLKLFTEKVEHSGAIDARMSVVGKEMTLEEAAQVYADNLKAFRD